VAAESLNDLEAGMQKTITVFAVMTLLSFGAEMHPRADEPGEEYKVYRAILKAKHNADDAKTLVIQKSTAPTGMAAHGSDEEKMISERVSPLEEGTLNSFTTRNQAPEILENKFDITAKVYFMDETEMNKIFRDNPANGWKAFYERYPGSGGILTFSRVGFDAKGKQALVLVSHSCGRLCGTGMLYVLSKADGDWKVTKAAMLWIS
jgi:hypothetical protein